MLAEQQRLKKDADDLSRLLQAEVELLKKENAALLLWKEGLAEQQRLRKGAEDLARLQQQEVELIGRRCDVLQAENAALLLWKEGFEKEKERENERRAQRDEARARTNLAADPQKASVLLCMRP